jgi:hypothetical protein
LSVGKEKEEVFMRRGQRINKINLTFFRAGFVRSLELRVTANVTLWAIAACCP